MNYTLPLPTLLDSVAITPPSLLKGMEMIDKEDIAENIIDQEKDKEFNIENDLSFSPSPAFPEKQNKTEDIDEERLNKLKQLEEKLKYKFNNICLLELSLTHKSFVGGEGEHFNCNERMEFLGDSVLELIVNLFLYNNFPTYTEGQLSKLKAVAVSRSTLAMCAKEMNLGDYIKFGVGELATGGREKPSNLSNALEAIVASIYLDGGFENTKEFVLSILKDKIYELDRDELKRDYKTALQEYWQAGSRKPPVYKVISETGPDHDKIFEVEVKLAGESYGKGIGRNKKEAEQRAAEKALETIIDRRRENESE
ncbi:ribonuclease III [Candidatus Poribacteria bacterium]|nr:ribonuclease III [Candidatus Poribacteria bacterium]